MRSREVRDAFIEQLGSPWATKLLGEWPNRRMGPIDRLNLARRAEVELQGAARADLGELEVRLREDAVAALGDGVGEPDPHRRGAAHARDLLPLPFARWERQSRQRSCLVRTKKASA